MPPGNTWWWGELCISFGGRSGSCPFRIEYISHHLFLKRSARPAHNPFGRNLLIAIQGRTKQLWDSYNDSLLVLSALRSVFLLYLNHGNEASSVTRCIAEVALTLLDCILEESFHVGVHYKGAELRLIVEPPFPPSGNSLRSTYITAGTSHRHSRLPYAKDPPSHLSTYSAALCPSPKSCFPLTLQNILCDAHTCGSA